MAKAGLFLLLILGLSILVSTFAAPAQSQTGGAAKSLDKIRAINTEQLKGLLVKREPARPLLVNFWATWCDPCRDEFPDLVKIDNQYRPKGLDFISISLDDLADLKTEVPKFLREMHASMPVYLLNVSDPEPAINAIDPAWGGALPATFLYNDQGRMVYKHFGRLNDSELRAEIEKLVGGKQ
jgi:thiol-disulfide isomerase/thioredoxin